MQYFIKNWLYIYWKGYSLCSRLLVSPLLNSGTYSSLQWVILDQELSAWRMQVQILMEVNFSYALSRYFALWSWYYSQLLALAYKIIMPSWVSWHGHDLLEGKVGPFLASVSDLVIRIKFIELEMETIWSTSIHLFCLNSLCYLVVQSPYFCIYCVNARHHGWIRGM